MKPEEKLATLEEILLRTGGVLVAYSGGVDSTFLASVAHQVLGERALAVTCLTETIPPAEAEEAAEIARRLGLRWRQIEVSALDCAQVRSNTPDRCYHCKKLLFERLGEIARAEGIGVVVDGSNVDDSGDFRPGERALAELGVLHPLREALMTKADVRALSRQRGLPTWDKPPAACLASRFPYGEQITREKLVRVARAEEVLCALGYRLCRVRSHGELARIELAPEELTAFVSGRAREASEKLKELGFRYVSLDLDGYRTGSMNEALEGERKTEAMR